MKPWCSNNNKSSNKRYKPPWSGVQTFVSKSVLSGSIYIFLTLFSLLWNKVLLMTTWNATLHFRLDRLLFRIKIWFYCDSHFRIVTLGTLSQCNTVTFGNVLFLEQIFFPNVYVFIPQAPYLKVLPCFHANTVLAVWPLSWKCNYKIAKVQLIYPCKHTLNKHTKQK